MKKIVTVGIFFILALGLTGCSWFQPAEPTVEQPTVKEEPETTPIVEPYTYENTKYSFALTFPATWGKILAKEQKIDNRIDIIITSEDKSKDISLSIFEKQPSPIMAALGDVGETDNYVIGYQSKHLDIYNLEKEGKDASKERALEEELESIVATFTAL